MMLLLDIGNTRVKWGCLEDGVLTTVGAVAHRGSDFRSAIEAAWQQLARPERVVMVSVHNQQFNNSLAVLVKALWGREPEPVLSQRESCGVVNAYAIPEQLGADRWAAMIAGYHLSKETCCIIDCGTAVTIDVVDSEGKHLGGLIIPGLHMMRDSLGCDTEGIRIETDTGNSKIELRLAKNTNDAVIGGSIYVLVAMLDRIVKDVEKTSGAGLKCIITGGDAAIVRPLLSNRYLYEPDLVLKGLALLVGRQS